jgi:hypothetical protein
MRKERELAADCWYEIRTAVNHIEQLLWTRGNVELFEQVFGEARGLFVFEIRGLKFRGAWVSFYIRPADGFRLPEIIQWVKQTFAVRFNLIDRRTGHIWGDRYWSRILDGEPPEDAAGYVFDAGVWSRDWRRIAAGGAGKGAAARCPARDAGVCPMAEKTGKIPRLPPFLPRRSAALPDCGR